VEDDQGEMVGAVGAAVHLSRLQEVLTPATLPEGTLVTVTHADDGTVVARSEDWESWVGQAIQWGDVTEAQMLAGPGLNRTHGADGVDRLWGFAPISGPEWVVFVGVPTEGVYGPVRTATIRRGGLALVVLLLAGLLGGFLYRSIGRAVTGVTADARAAAGRAGVRIQPRGPLELDQLVHEFNRTLESRERTDGELTRAERRLHESRRLEAVGHLAAGVAHDFNNVLTVIQGEAGLLGDDLPEGDPRRDGVARIQVASDRAARMVARLLAVGRKDRVRPRRLDPARSIMEMEESLRREFGDRIDLDVRTDLAIPSIYMDPGHLEEVIRNLVRNACDAMPNGGRVRVSLGEETNDRGLGRDGEGGEDEDPALDEETFVVIRVEDPGTGMSPEVLERAFDPFFTTKAHGQGSGLGLATVHGIVTRAGGDVMVNSEPGRGTRVTVLLPAADGVSEVRRDAGEGR
jgi:signal transduction histidine kinase